MAKASGVGVDVDLAKVLVDPAVAEVSKLFGMDPLDAISEGTLLIATEAEAAGEVLARLRKKGIPASDIGTFTKSGGACTDRGRPFRPADRDPFWVAFSRAFAGEIA
jgi:hydrogenase maturation factor